MNSDNPLRAGEAYDRAAATFDTIIRLVRDDQWAAATPCEDWDVRALVNHVVGEDRWLPPLLAGATVDDVGDALDGDLLGDDPIGAWSAAYDGGLEASRGAAMHQLVGLSSGPTSVEEYLRQVAADHTVHAWDLAVAIGADPALDADLVASVATWFASNEQAYRTAGLIGPRKPLGPDADAQDRLLAMFGRRNAVLDSIAVIDQFGAAFDSRAVDTIMSHMTADCVFESTAPPDGVRFEGQLAVRDAFEKLFAESAEARFTTESRFAAGDRVVVHWRYDWGGGRPDHVRGIDVFRVSNGLVAEKLSYVKG